MHDSPLKLESVGIKFNLNTGKDISVRKDGIKAFKTMFTRRSKSEFWALKDLDFEAGRGEIVGIIGGNGAGKSTLLKIIASIYSPTTGNMRVEGNIAPLIELGAAFIPELTGIENIFLTGSIYQVPRKTIKDNLDKIIDFSGLKRFVEVPIKNYSSGMFIRLAFSIVIFFQPDIVLIDEVFAVGDERFQQKSFQKILSFKERGATLILVSHNTNLVTKFCDRVMVLDQGKKVFLGEAGEAVAFYRDILKRGGVGLEGDSRLTGKLIGQEDGRQWGNKKIEITSVRFVNNDGEEASTFYSGDYFEARISYVSHLKENSAVFGINIATVYRFLIYGPNTMEENLSGELPRKGVVRFIIPSLSLLEGDYLFSAAAYDSLLKEAYDHHDLMYQFRVLSRGAKEYGCVRLGSRWAVESD